MSDEKEFKNVIDPDALKIVSTGKPMAQKKEDFETLVHDAGVGIGTGEMYDRFGKLVYLFDNSGSMAEGMSLTDTIARYDWSPEVLAAFRKAMADQLEEMSCTQQSDDEFPEDAEEVKFTSIPVDDKELKELIVDQHLADFFNIRIPTKNYGYTGNTKSKIETVKDAARGFVTKRFAKYPEANVMVYGFDDQAYVLASGASGASETEVLNGINNLDANGGGTRIFSAVKTAIGEFRKRPSPVGAHHVVLVTDGMDADSALMTENLPALLEQGIVLDFIYVKGQSNMDGYYYEAKVKAIKEVCEKTGGEYTEVGTVADFQQKFLAVSNRPMLPAARS